MDALLTAGGIPQPDELLYPFTQGKPKAMLDILGKPMVQWVLDALSGSRLVENILGGIHKVLEINPAADRVIMVSSDIPAITPEMVDWEVQNSLESDVDLCYNVVTRQVIEARYPSSRRTFTRLKGLEVCGGDMHVIHTSVASMNPEIWERLIASRKNPVKQAAILGFDTLILMLLRLITLDQAVTRVSARLNMTGQAFICPFAEIAMDIDKPNQLELMRADLARQEPA
jgi:GTP:adenosylcobinamide-phosphate guanylyltransferase